MTDKAKQKEDPTYLDKFVENHLRALSALIYNFTPKDCHFSLFFIHRGESEDGKVYFASSMKNEEAFELMQAYMDKQTHEQERDKN
jgi:hypothetical protein